MPNVIVESEIAVVTDAIGVMVSATTLISLFAAKLQAGIDAALAGGALAAELAPLTDLQAEVVAKKTALADAVAANA